MLTVAFPIFDLEQQLRSRVNLAALCWTTHAEKKLTAKHKVRRLMPELATVTAKYLPLNHKDINLAVVVKSIYVQFLTQELNLAVKGGHNYTNILF